METFEIASGSILGRVHRETGKNNQDSSAILNRPSYIVALVCDGCSDGAHSDVGAALGSRLMANAIERQIVKNSGSVGKPETLLGVAVADTLAHLRVLALNCSGFDSFTKVVADHFLFTVVGTVVTTEQTFVFSLGDGVYCINGETQILGPFPGNAPPYLGYALLDSPQQMVVNAQVSTEEVKSLLVGTDGVSQIQLVAEYTLPGKQELVGPLSQFLNNDKLYTNSDAVRRRLTLMNRDHVAFCNGGLEKTVGLLQDDTTLVAIRRKT